MSATPAPSKAASANSATPEQLALAAKLSYELFIQPDHAAKLSQASSASEIELTILFGWTGSTQRHLSKYAHVHQSQGASTVARVGMIPPFTTTESIRDALQLLVFLQKVFPHPPKVICHVFSNGGLKPFFGFLHAVETSPQFQPWGKNLIGTVFDSCPARFTILGFSYVRSMLYRWRLVRLWMFAYTLSWGLVSAFFRHLLSGFGLFYKTPTEEENFGMPILTQSATLKRTPSLFIYSSSDKMTDYTFVEEHIAKMKAERMDIQTVRFEDSEHVAHLVKHPEAYAAKLQAFRKYLLPPETDDWTTMDKTLLRKASAVAEQRVSAL